MRVIYIERIPFYKKKSTLITNNKNIDCMSVICLFVCLFLSVAVVHSYVVGNILVSPIKIRLINPASHSDIIIILRMISNNRHIKQLVVLPVWCHLYDKTI